MCDARPAEEKISIAINQPYLEDVQERKTNVATAELQVSSDWLHLRIIETISLAKVAEPLAEIYAHCLHELGKVSSQGIGDVVRNDTLNKRTKELGARKGRGSTSAEM
jgi:hypothetical protein